MKTTLAGLVHKQRPRYGAPGKLSSPEEIDDASGKRDTGKGETHWGYHLLLDISDCNANINSNAAIRRFFDELVAKLKMKKLSSPVFIDVSGVEGRGVTAWQPITTSHITIHSDDDKMSAYIDVFSCDPYDPQVAIDCVKKWFGPKRMGDKWLTRDAGKWPER